jgi:hypothetical protein
VQRNLKILLLYSKQVLECPYKKEIPKKQVTFSFDYGVVNPLYTASLACRDPIIWREAILLLASRPRREGIWGSAMYGTIALG